MDWLKGMNEVIDYIESNLTSPISYEVLSKIVGVQCMNSQESSLL